MTFFEIGKKQRRELNNNGKTNKEHETIFIGVFFSKMNLCKHLKTSLESLMENVGDGCFCCRSRGLLMGLLITSTALFQNSIDVKFVVKLRDEWWVMRSWDSKVMAWSEDSGWMYIRKMSACKMCIRWRWWSNLSNPDCDAMRNDKNAKHAIRAIRRQEDDKLKGNVLTNKHTWQTLFNSFFFILSYFH